MRKLFYLLITIFGLSSVVSAQSKAYDYANSIKIENVTSHLYTLASPKMMGRDTGKKGQKDAGKYITSFYRENGVDSMGFNGYYQKFNLFRYDNGTANIFLKNRSNLNSKFQSVPLFTDFIANSSITINDSMAIKYLGFGKDYIVEDMSDKVVLLLLDKNLKNTHANIKDISSKTGAKVFIILFEKNGAYFYNSDKDII